MQQQDNSAQGTAQVHAHVTMHKNGAEQHARLVLDIYHGTCSQAKQLRADSVYVSTACRQSICGLTACTSAQTWSSAELLACQHSMWLDWLSSCSCLLHHSVSPWPGEHEHQPHWGA